MKDNPNEIGIFVTAVYAKCTPVEREDLWESIVNMNSQMNGPWYMQEKWFIMRGHRTP